MKLLENYGWNLLYEFENNTGTATIHTNTENLFEEMINGPVEKFKVVTILDSPFLDAVEYFHDGKNKICPGDAIPCLNKTNYLCCYGYSVDLLTHIMELLSFKSELYLVDDQKYGRIYNATNYNGLVGEVYEKKADMAIAALTVTHDRSKYIDFSTPFMEAEIGLVTRKHSYYKEYFGFPFSTGLSHKVKMSICFMFTAMLLCIYIFEQATINIKQKCSTKYSFRTTNTLYILGETFTYTGSLLFQRDMGSKLPSSIGARITTICFAFAMLGIVGMFTASITATQVIQKFGGLKDSRVMSKQILILIFINIYIYVVSKV